MLILDIFAAVCLILGVYFFAGKKNFSKLEALMNRPLFGARGIQEKYNRVIGLFLVLFSAALYFISIRLKR
jgi:preprotein translocase subunit SecG